MKVGKRKAIENEFPSIQDNEEEDLRAAAKW